MSKFSRILIKVKYAIRFIRFIKDILNNKDRLQNNIEVFENMKIGQLKTLDRHFISQNPKDSDPNR